jgi:hypothetical protein
MRTSRPAAVIPASHVGAAGVPAIVEVFDRVCRQFAPDFARFVGLRAGLRDKA